MNILGLHREPWHDTGAAVIKEEKGEIKVISITQERLDRVKDSRAFPEDAIQYCLKEQNIKSLDQMNYSTHVHVCIRRLP